MDIWRWVHGREEALREDGHHELAKHIYDISNHTVNDKFDLVDQVYHAALPMCQTLDDKWLEVYFRHWRLQAHVLKNYDAKGHLSEAISLLEFSHGDETKECPQRICSVQDLASCYGIKDGPGFAEERISVCKETLAQIDGSWPCYQCVGSELLDALIDKNDFEQAEVELDLINKEISKFQGKADDDLVLTRTRMFLGKRQPKMAWEIIKDAKNPEGGAGFVRHVELLKALTLCYLERWDEAHQTCLSYEDIVLAATYYSDWTKVQLLLVRQGIVENNRDLRYKFHNLAETLIRKDATRVAFEVCERLIELCVTSGEKRRADQVIQTMTSLIDGLNRDLGASETLKELRRSVSNLELAEVVVSFDTVEALLDHTFETETEEFSAISSALMKWSDDGRLYARKSDLFQSHFQDRDAYEFIEAAYQKYRGSAALESRYGEAFLVKYGFEAYQKEFPIEDLEGLSNGAIWNRGFKYFTHYEANNPQKALDVLKVIEEYWSEDVYLLGRIAGQHIELKDYDSAISYRRKQIALAPDDNNHKWDLLIAGTLSQDVSLIQEMATFLKIEVDADGLFPTKNRPRIRLQWTMQNGLIEIYHAVRLGPALARITSICPIADDHQFYGREVVFDPTPLNKLDQEDDEGYACDVEGNYSLLYPSPLLTLKDPAYKTYTVDGIHPGQDALQALSKKIEAAGFIFRVWSTNAYELTWTENKTERTDPAVYIYILISDGEEGTLNGLLDAFNQGLEHPLVWVELANHLGDGELRRKQASIIEKYGIEP